MAHPLARLLDGSTPKHYLEGASRSCSPEETLARIQPHLAGIGVTRVANVTGLDRVGIPVVMVVRPNSRSLSVSQGKGVTLAAARISGIMESVELYHAERWRGPVVIESHRHLSIEGVPVAPPERLPQARHGGWDPSLPQPWAQAVDVVDGTATLVPFDLVHARATVPPPPGNGRFLITTNGLASGNNLAEAALHGLCEVIERDALARWAARGDGSGRLDLRSVDDPVAQLLLERFDRAGVEVAAWQLGGVDGDVEVPAFRAVVVERAGDALLRPLGAAVGAGCHPDRRVALVRALTEAAQSRLTQIAGSRDDLPRSSYQSVQNPEARGAVERLLDPGAEPAAPWRRQGVTGGNSPTGHTVEDDLRAVLAALEQSGMEHPLAVDLTPPGFPMAIVRVIVPGLEGPHTSPSYKPGVRARAAIRGATPVAVPPPSGAPAGSEPSTAPPAFEPGSAPAGEKKAVVVFLGPSLPADEARALLEARYLPPVAQGDVMRLLADPPAVMVVIDGVFELQPAVWHKELLAALAQGVRVFGAASMGALRAAELAAFGMEGVGEVFEWYHRRAMTGDDPADDDEVAIAHGPADSGYVGLSVAMVDVRDLCHRAIAEAVVTEETAALAVAAAKDVHYADRTWAAISAAAAARGGDEASLAALERWARAALAAGDGVKARDARAVLRTAAEFLTRPWPPPVPAVRPEPTVFLARLRAELASEGASPQGRPAGPLADASEAAAVVAANSARLGEPGEVARKKVLLRMLARWEAERLGLVVSEADLKASADGFRQEHGMLARPDVLAWMEAEGVTAGCWLEFLGDRCIAEAIDHHYDAEISRQLPDHLRIATARLWHRRSASGGDQAGSSR